MTKDVSLIGRLRAWSVACQQDPNGTEDVLILREAAEEVERLRGLVVEMLELADNWPGIAYTQDLETRARACLSAEPEVPQV